MKNKLLKVSVLALAIILLLQVGVLATIEKLTLKMLTDKDTYTVGNKVVATVNWTEEMESAGFNVKYDADKLTFVSLTDASGNKLSDDFFNAESAGFISFNWFTIGTKASKMVFTFEAKAEGKAVLKVEGASGFGYTNENGELASPNEYDTTTSGTKEITIVAKVVEEKPEEQPEQKPTGGNNVTTQQPTDDKKNESINTNVNTNKDTNKNTSASTSTTNKKDNTTASGKMPQTGAENIIFVIALIALVGTIGFIKYRGLSDI